VHGTRSEFINNVATRLLEKVNAEAKDLTQANKLFQTYLAEFCDEYDRCGYGHKNTDQPSPNPLTRQTND
jgi:hypothetical protein